MANALVSSDVGIWSAIEMGLGIVSSCLATTKPIFTRLLLWRGKGFSSKGRPSNKSGTRQQHSITFSKKNSGPFTALEDGSNEADDIELARSFKATDVAVIRNMDDGSNKADDIERARRFTANDVAIIRNMDDETFSSGHGRPRASTIGVAVTSWSTMESRRGNSRGAVNPFDAPLQSDEGIMKTTVVEISRC